MSEFVLPGDRLIPTAALKQNEKYKICARGIIMRDEEPHASLPGFFHENKEKIWINTFSQKYFPQTADKVIGIVTQKIGDFWKVDISGIEKAEIDFMSFENATKRNRPDVRIGDLLYGNIKVINKHLSPVMSCVNDLGKARGQGLIPRAGTIISVSCSYTRRLLQPNCKILIFIEKSFAIETTIGVNGRVWINGSYDDIKIVRSIIQRFEKVIDADIEKVFYEMIAVARGEVPSIPADTEMKQEVKAEIKDEIEDDDPMNTI
uniref:Ribosomal RNA-processing protein 40 n=1 Tax=Panagrolaimus superbus TaxID=310955 RepID=A0A914Z2Q6_9BILA